MIDISFEELVEAAQKLRPEQKAALVQTLNVETMDEDASLTREQAIVELDSRDG
jgi:hypothetical protein